MFLQRSASFWESAIPLTASSVSFEISISIRRYPCKLPSLSGSRS